MTTSTMTAIDLFAGVGGQSEGARMAGVEVKWAANHWPIAVSTHQRNHAGAVHSCQDLMQADWSKVPSHDIQLASPACTGSSNARGKDRPHHDVLRSTAWAVVSCAEFHRSPFVAIENVPEMTSWLLYPAWLDAMRRLGYTESSYIIDAADHGVPQNRERLHLVFSRSRAPLQLRLPRREHKPVADVIQWDAGTWSKIDKPGRSANTLRRIANARAAGLGERFVAPFYGSGSGLTGRSVARPLGTLTTRDRWAVIDGDRMRMLSVDEGKAVMGLPASYALPANKKTAMHLLGNGVCPQVICDLLQALRVAG